MEALKADGKAIATDSTKEKEALRNASRATAEPPAREDGKGTVPLVPKAGSPPGSDADAEGKQAITSRPAGRCSAPTGGEACTRGWGQLLPGCWCLEATGTSGTLRGRCSGWRTAAGTRDPEVLQGP